MFSMSKESLKLFNQALHLKPYTWSFTRPLPRRNPPKAPAGLDHASDAAKARWVADSYKLQVYDDEEERMVTSEAGAFRLSNLREREKLMGFDDGYLSNGLHPKLSSCEKELVGGK